jgi:PIN domain nuclease of toxin-antitoxin system
LKLLLDTHIWIWSQQEPKRLARRIREELDNQSNELWLSPISTWELLMLLRKGKVRLDRDPGLWIAESTSLLFEASLTHEIVVVAERLQLPHADPADRFLAATAKVLELTLVTADRKLLGLGDIATLANR